MRFLPLLICLIPSAVFAQDASKTWNFSDTKAAPLASTYAAPGGVTSNVDIKVVNGALKFTNKSGGSFGLKFDVTPFDANQYPTIAFDYTRSADTKVNIFFKVNGIFYGVIFSGPDRVRPGSFLLGTLPNVSEKGHAVLPIRDWLRHFQPKADKLNVEEMLVGNWDNEGYLLAGIGGNTEGSTWTLKSFTLQAPPKEDASHIGKPQFVGNDIVWPTDGAAIDTKTATLSVDDQKFDFGSPYLHLDTDIDAKNQISRRVVLDAAAAGLTFKDGQTINLTLGTETSSLVFNLGSHATAAPYPRLQWDGIKVPGSDFETDTGGWNGSNAVLLLDPKTPFAGKSSLEFFNPRTASPFDASLSGAPFDAAQTPVITFAYKADDRLREDFRLNWEGKSYFIHFFDRDGAQTPLGNIAGLVADNQWHRAQIPLLDMMKHARPDATNFKIDAFGLSDDAWMGNARGVSFNLDDFHFAPRVTDAIRATVSLPDISGTSAVSWSLDQNPDTIADRSPEGGPKLDISLAGKAAGVWWLHVRAQNGGGSWSDSANFPVVVG